MDMNAFIEPIQHAPGQAAEFIGQHMPSFGQQAPAAPTPAPAPAPENHFGSTILGS